MKLILKQNNMTMTPRLSKVMLTTHITFSVDWLGAVAVFCLPGTNADLKNEYEDNNKS